LEKLGTYGHTGEARAVASDRDDRPPSAKGSDHGAVTRVCVVARVRMYRDGLAHELGRGGQIEVVATAADWRSCVACARRHAPDAVVLDLEVPAHLDLVTELLEAAPGVQVIGLAVSSVEDILRCAEAGIAGYMTCEDSLDELADRIESVCRGEMPCSPEVASRLLERVAELAHRAQPPPVAERLTRREREVVELIGDGLSNKEIAKRLQIELATVKNHVHNILEKLGARRRGEIGNRLRRWPAAPGTIGGSRSSASVAARRSGLTD
jgi:DNA-binding NarL/FixJ family response regulator